MLVQILSHYSPRLIVFVGDSEERGASSLDEQIIDKLIGT